MQVTFTVIENEVTKKNNIDFTPKKANINDIAFDIRANNIVLGEKVIEDWSEYTIPSGQSIVVGIGANLVQENNIKLVTNNTLVSFYNNIIEIIDKVIKNINPEAIESFELKDLLKLYPSSEVHSRSGLAFNSNIKAFNGQIDNTYQKEIRVKLTNNSRKPFTIKYGDRIGQLEIKLVPEINVEKNIVESLSQLDMGNRGGFGSTGVK
jgi:dUTPase